MHDPNRRQQGRRRSHAAHLAHFPSPMGNQGSAARRVPELPYRIDELRA